MRRWFGTTDELGEALRVDSRCTRFAHAGRFALGPIRRRGELLHFEVMRRACDKLAKMPFADRDLEPVRRFDAHRSGRVRATGADGATSEATVEWQATRLEKHRDVLESHLLDEPSNPVFEVISRDAVEKALTGPPVTDSLALRSLYGALTAAVWLGHHELQRRAERNPERSAGSRSPNRSARDDAVAHDEAVDLAAAQAPGRSC